MIYIYFWFIIGLIGTLGARFSPYNNGKMKISKWIKYILSGPIVFLAFTMESLFDISDYIQKFLDKEL